MAFDLIRDIANYGSNLIPRCFSSGDKGLKDAVMLEPYHKPKNAHHHGICADCAYAIPTACNSRSRRPCDGGGIQLINREQGRSKQRQTQ